MSSNVSQWNKATLDDLCIKITDGAHQSPPSVEQGLPMASVKDMTSFGINISSSRQISIDDFQKLVRQGCQPQIGDVLIAKDGATALDTVCEIKKPLDAVLLSSIAIIRPNSDKIISSYLRYYLDAAPTREYMKAAFTTGAAIPRVVLRDFKRITVSYPDLSIQRRIASILSAYDDLIENNTRRIAILEEMARRIYEEWFVKFKFPGHEKVKMVDSELGEIPEGWKIQTLGEYAFITMGQSPKSESYNQDGNGLPFHQGVTDFGRHFPIHRMYCTAQARIAEFGDILMSVRAPVGRINLAPSKMAIGRGLCAMRSKSGQQRFLLHLLLEKFREEDSMGNGAIFKAVTKEEVYGICFPLPSLNLLNQFETIVEPFWGRIENLTKKNANLRTTRDFLLPKLISGEIDVSKLPEPEEAAA